MIGDFVLWLVPLLAAIMFLLRAIRERKERMSAERALHELREHSRHIDDDHLRFLGIVAHELRSPLSAIMGYQELLADGIYGPLNDRAREALGRIGNSARQLLTLSDGMEELAGRKETSPAKIVAADVNNVIGEVLTEAQREAKGRGTNLEVDAPPRLADLRTDPARLCSTLELLLLAVNKLAAHDRLRLTITQDQVATRFVVTGDGLDRYPLPDDDRDLDLASFPIDSGAALHLAIARRLAQTLGGRLYSRPDKPAALVLELPSAT